MKSSHRLAALVWLGMVLPLSAQSSPVIPREVVLYVQDDLPETSFVDPPVCALERVVRVPVRVETSRIQYGPDLLLRGRQYDVAALARRLSATEAAKDRPAFRISSYARTSLRAATTSSSRTGSAKGRFRNGFKSPRPRACAMG